MRLHGLTVGAVVLVLATVGLAQSKPPASKPAGPKADETTLYSAKALGFEFRVPTAWKVGMNNESSGVYAFELPTTPRKAGQPPQAGSLMIYGAQPCHGEADLAHEVEFERTAKNPDGSPQTILKDEPTKFKGEPAHLLVFEWPIAYTTTDASGKKQPKVLMGKEYHIITVHGGKKTVLVLSSDPAGLEARMKLFNKVVDSFAWTGEAAK